MPLIERFTPGGNLYLDGQSTFAVLREFFQKLAENRDTMDQQITEGAVTEAVTSVRPDTLQPANDPDAIFSVTDEDGLRTWIEAAADGGPTEHAVSKFAPTVAPVVAEQVGVGDMDTAVNGLVFSVVDEEGRRTWLEAVENGGPSPRSLSLLRAALGGTAGTTTAAAFPTLDWAHWGDSLTAAGWGPTHMAPLTGRNHYNGGWGGQNTDQIAARHGGVPALFTAPSNTLPASGAVTLTNVRRTPLSAGGNRRGSFVGVKGVLALSTDGTTHTFTRDAAGDAVTMPAATPFVPEDGEQHRGRTVTIWAGRNGFKTEDPLMIVASIQQMIDYLTPNVRRVIVMEVPPWVGEETGVGFRPRLDTLNAELRAAFRPYWLPIATWLRTDEAAAYAGITFTADDRTDIANGLTPRSLRSDDGHLNDAGNLAVAKRVHKEAQNRGWL